MATCQLAHRRCKPTTPPAPKPCLTNSPTYPHLTGDHR